MDGSMHILFNGTNCCSKCSLVDEIHPKREQQKMFRFCF